MDTPATSQGKRKAGPGDSSDRSARNKKHRGNEGKWKTPEHINKNVSWVERGVALDVGSEGLWVSCVRGLEKRAISEFTRLCEEYGKDLRDTSVPSEDCLPVASSGGDDDKHRAPDGQGDDIENSIKRELRDMADPSSDSTSAKGFFTPVPSGMACVFFMKTRSPVRPVELVSRICSDARATSDIMKRKCRYVNRLTPVTAMEKATENGIAKVAKQVLSPWFVLAEEEPVDETNPKLGPSYAIRYTIRHHSTFKSNALIKLVASLISNRHKVDLGNPDKIILVDVYQLLCGMSVVEGPEYEALKRYNINELYKAAAARPSENVSLPRIHVRMDRHEPAPDVSAGQAGLATAEIDPQTQAE